MSNIHRTAATWVGLIAAALMTNAMAVAQSKDADEKVTITNEEPAAGEKEPELKVSVRPPERPVRLREPFDIGLTIENVTKVDQIFRVMSCSWNSQWQCSSRRLSPKSWGCWGNFPQTIKLSPGGVYRKQTSMTLSEGKALGTVSFEMGFTPLGFKNVIWSNSVIVQVESDETRKDRERFNGRWTAVAVERDGKPVAADEVRRFDVTLGASGTDEAEKWDDLRKPHISFGSDVEPAAAPLCPNGTFDLDAGQQPKTITVVVTPSQPSDKEPVTMLGIYELDGDTLKLMLGRPGQARPGEFKTAPKSGSVIVTFQRDQPRK